MERWYLFKNEGNLTREEKTHKNIYHSAERVEQWEEKKRKERRGKGKKEEGREKEERGRERRKKEQGDKKIDY